MGGQHRGEISDVYSISCGVEWNRDDWICGCGRGETEVDIMVLCEGTGLVIN